MLSRLLFIGLSFFVAEYSVAQQTVGLFTQETGSLPGYVLFAPLGSGTTYLIDKCGKEIHTWPSTYEPGQSIALLPDGNLLRPGDSNNFTFNSGGRGGIIQLIDWDGNLIWQYAISSSTECQHHEAKQLPNGNILAISWEVKTEAEAVAAGRNPSTVFNTLWCEKIVELQPIGSNQANIVWEWHAWDHLVQDYDASKLNYGVVAAHPELINLNFTDDFGPQGADWLHVNAVDYNAALDQLIVSCHNFSEFWIIDHSTTTAEAASHTGGVHGRGGDLLYRWGNPQSYDRGTTFDKKLFGQHNPHWIEDGLPDAGKIMIFNNGVGRPDGNYSTVDIIITPVDSLGNYNLPSSSAPYGPDSAEWSYQAPVPYEFYSQVISGAQRLSNGNTLIDEGTSGNFFEIDENKNTVWNYVNPVGVGGPVSQGSFPFMGGAFRCLLYEPDYPGLAGHSLLPGDPVELNPLNYNCTMLTGIDPAFPSNKIELQIVNPFGEEIRIASNKDITDATFVLYDLNGKVVRTWYHLQLQDHEWLSLLVGKNTVSGIYFLQLKSSQQFFSTSLLHIGD
jgi:hypothetical protein